MSSYRDRVKALLDKYDPEKSASTDATLAKYAGKEEPLMKALVKKYGPEPEGAPAVTAAPAANAEERRSIIHQGAEKLKR
jgi:hypothetical protein